MSKQDLLKTQTCVLRVNIDCDGCKSKVKRILHKIDDVYATTIDMQQGKVTVTGNVDPDVLIRKLEKSGKRAQLLSSDKGNNSNKKSDQVENVNDQLLKKLLVQGGGDEVNKSQQKSGISAGGDGKNLQQLNFQQLLEQMKSGSPSNKDLNMKDQQKPAAIPTKVDKLPGKGDGHDFEDISISSGDDELDEDFEDDDEEEEEEEEEEDQEDEFDDDDDESDNGGDQHPNYKQQKTFVPITSKDLVKDKKEGADGDDQKVNKGGGGGDDKKNDGIMSMIGKVIGGNSEGKDGSLSKKVGGEGGAKSQGGGKNGGDGKNSGEGGGKSQDGKKSGGPKNGNMGGGGGMGQMGQYPLGPMGYQFPMMNMNGHDHAGMVPVPGYNPYQQQQYMAMIMNQHTAMYGRPPPGYGYVPVPPPVYHDHITHMFSDDNPGSCRIM